MLLPLEGLLVALSAGSTRIPRPLNTEPCNSLTATRAASRLGRTTVATQQDLCFRLSRGRVTSAGPKPFSSMRVMMSPSITSGCRFVRVILLLMTWSSDADASCVPFEFRRFLERNPMFSAFKLCMMDRCFERNSSSTGVSKRTLAMRGSSFATSGGQFLGSTMGGRTGAGAARAGAIGAVRSGERSSTLGRFEPAKGTSTEGALHSVSVITPVRRHLSNSSTAACLAGEASLRETVITAPHNRASATSWLVTGIFSNMASTPERHSLRVRSHLSSTARPPAVTKNGK
mmetsp:Transcript_34742/g.92769  ORF Transcript_34742/g.92769 Transcript_34742/m.92769 type:complete len:288 (+) Transcript_34742:365-1228(+)